MLNMFVLLLLSLLTFSLNASTFKEDIVYEYITETGIQEKGVFNIILRKENNGYYFNVGSQSTYVPDIPKKYSLFIMIQENKLLALDISKKRLNSLKLKLKEEVIDFGVESQGAFRTRHYAEHIKIIEGVEVKERRYFTSRPSRINFIINEEGVSEILFEGFFKPQR